MTRWQRLCPLADIPEGGARGFDPSGEGHDSVFVIRRHDTLFAYRDACPHDGTPLPWRKDCYLDGAGAHVVCFAHGARFEIETGLCLSGPCIGEALTPIRITMGPDNEILIETEDLGCQYSSDK